MLYANLLLSVLYHIVMEMKIREACLQTGTFIYKAGVLGYKWDSRVTIYLRITKNENQCLIYNRPIPPTGVMWNDLVNW